MAIDFPANPVIDQEFTGGDMVYRWRGYAWVLYEIVGGGAVLPVGTEEGTALVTNNLLEPVWGHPINGGEF